MDIGVFDHLDRGGKPGAAFYRERLEIVQAYEAAGFYSYHIAEHHFTPLGMAPSPSVFLASVAERTTRLRFGPLVYALPLYHPLRLIQEICMLDNLSGGRLDMGFGRGASSIEAGYYGKEPSQETYAEALDAILKGLTSGERFTFKGKLFDFDEVPLWLQPVQKPHPPMWYGVHSVESSERAARSGLNIVSADGVAETRSFTDRYRTIWSETRAAEALPRLGLTRFVVVAETDEEALRIARHAYLSWYESFNWLFRLKGTSPRLGERGANFDIVMQQGRGIAGSPKTVRDFLAGQLDASGCNYFVGQFAFGDMTLQETVNSIELFAAEISPHLCAQPANAARLAGMADHNARRAAN